MTALAEQIVATVSIEATSDDAVPAVADLVRVAPDSIADTVDEIHYNLVVRDALEDHPALAVEIHLEGRYSGTGWERLADIAVAHALAAAETLVGAAA